MSAALLAIEQNAGHDEGIPWVLEDGQRIEGHDNVRRTDELRHGLLCHEGVRIECASASDEQVEGTLGWLHDPGYLESLRSIHPGRPVLRADLAPPGMSPDMLVTAEAVAASFEGVRTAISAANRTLAGVRLTYALSRPPGHHAGPNWLAGYCYLNTTAAAARTLCAGGVRHVGILDLDIHYPNGTAAIAESIESIELHSLHAWPVTNVPERTVTPRTSREHVVEFRRPPSSEAYLGAVSSSIEQLADGTDVIVVSLGYDTVKGDPHGCWSFSPSIFASIGGLLAASGVPVCVIQEGGYAQELLAQCSHCFASGLLEERRVRR